jgi:hypothetical protein
MATKSKKEDAEEQGNLPPWLKKKAPAKKGGKSAPAKKAGKRRSC